MATMSMYEVKTHLSSVLNEVAAGRSVVVTRHGTPVARIIPAEATQMAPEQVVTALQEARRGATLGMPVRALVAEGRR